MRGSRGVPDSPASGTDPLLKDETSLLQVQTLLLRTRTPLLYVTELGNERPVGQLNSELNILHSIIFSTYINYSLAMESRMGEAKNYTATIRTGDTAELYVCEGIEGEWFGEWERRAEEMEWGS